MHLFKLKSVNVSVPNLTIESVGRPVQWSLEWEIICYEFTSWKSRQVSRRSSRYCWRRWRLLWQVLLTVMRCRSAATMCRVGLRRVLRSDDDAVRHVSGSVYLYGRLHPRARHRLPQMQQSVYRLFIIYLFICLFICSSTHITYNQTRVRAGQQGTNVHW